MLTPELFKPEAVSAETSASNAKLIEILTPTPNWWDVGAQPVRESRRRGEGPFPAPVYSPRARTRALSTARPSASLSIPSRQSRPPFGVSRTAMVTPFGAALQAVTARSDRCSRG